MNRIINKKTLNIYIELKKFFIEASSIAIASIRSALLFWENGHKWKRANDRVRCCCYWKENGFKDRWLINIRSY